MSLHSSESNGFQASTETIDSPAFERKTVLWTEEMKGMMDDAHRLINRCSLQSDKVKRAMLLVTKGVVGDLGNNPMEAANDDEFALAA